MHDQRRRPGETVTYEDDYQSDCLCNCDRILEPIVKKGATEEEAENLFQTGFVGLVKKRWKTLKDYYRVELKKIDKPKSGSIGSIKKEPAWPYFQQLAFIKNTLGVCKRHCRLRSPTAAVSQTENTSVIDSEIILGNSFSTTEIKEESSDVMPVTNIGNRDSSSCNKQSKKPKNRKRSCDFKDNHLENEKKKMPLLEDASKEDDDVLFLHSLLPDIRSLSRPDKLKLRMEMQRVVYNAVIRQSTTFVHVPVSTCDTHYSSSINSPNTESSVNEHEETSNMEFS